MSDLLADAKEWLATQGDRVQTHSAECHKWHHACLVSRLLRELESRTGMQNTKRGVSVADCPERECTPDTHTTQGEGTRQKRCIAARLRDEIVWEPDVGELLAEAADEIERLRLTDDEREAIRRAARVADEFHDARLSAALRGLLDRAESGGK